MGHVTAVESVFEKTTTVEEQEKAEAERLAKEAEAEKAKNNNSTEEASETEGEKKEGDEDSWAKLGDTISSFFGEKEKEGEDKKETEKGDSKDSEKSKKDKKKKDKKKEKKEEKEFKPIVETIKEPLEFKLEIVDFNDLSKDQFEVSRKKLVDLDAEKAKNNNSTEEASETEGEKKE